MYKIIIQILIGSLLAGFGSWKLKGCTVANELSRMDKVVAEKDKLISKKNDTLKTRYETIISLKREIRKHQEDSSIVKGQIDGIQIVNLALRNENTKYKVQLGEIKSSGVFPCDSIYLVKNLIGNIYTQIEKPSKIRLKK